MPAVTPATCMTKYVSWVAQRASTAAGAKRTNRLPPWLRSFLRSGPGTIRQPAAVIFGDTRLMDFLA